MQIKISPQQTLGLTGQYYRNRFDGSSYLYGGPNLAGIMGGKPELLEQRGGFVSDVMPKTERALFNADYHAAQVWGGQDLYVQGFWRQDFGRYVFLGITSTLVELPVFATSRPSSADIVTPP